MDDWSQTKNVALRAAFELRRRFSIARESPVNVFDVCRGLGIDVRFSILRRLRGCLCVTRVE